MRQHHVDKIAAYIYMAADRAVPVDIEARLMADGVSLRKVRADLDR